MAPFGKNFLKARLKNRTKDAEPTAGKEIQVTVCNEEKVVCGVTKHTTCADMIQALLEDHRGAPDAKRLLQGEAKDFCLVERWKGFERALPPLTRILRLWYAWGDQRASIQFILVKTCDFVPQQPSKTAKAKSGAGRTKRWEQSRAKHPQALPADKQKRLVKKAFRKLERLHQESRAAPGAQEVDRMVQLILNQDHTIRQQIQRMRELDLEIQQAEDEAGVEEQQEAVEAGGWSPEAGGGAQRLQEFVSANDGVERLELQVQMHNELIQQLSLDIDAELQRAGLWEEEGAAAAATAAAPWLASEADESFYAAQLERLQGELQHSLCTGVSLHNQAAQLDEQLQLHEATLLSKDRECWQLAAHLEALQLGATAAADAEETPGAAQCQLPCPATQPNTGKTLKGSTSPLDATDTDSDTGISSTHSQDSLSPCLDFPPPLDTDV